MELPITKKVWINVIFCLIHSDYLYEIKNGGTRLGKGKFEGK